MCENIFLHQFRLRSEERRVGKECRSRWAMDVVEDGGDGWGGGRWLVWEWGVLARTVYEWENGGRGTGNHAFGTGLSEIWESYKLSPHLKFGRLVGWE